MKPVTTFVAAGLVAVALAGCAAGGIGDGSTNKSGATTVDLKTIEWNAAKADLGTVSAVTELGPSTVLFGSRGVTVMSGGAITTSVAGTTGWTSATNLPAADGTGTWVVGIDGTGHLQHLRAGATLEDVSARYGLSDVKLGSVVPLVDKTVAFAWTGGFAIADGTTVTRYDDGTLTGAMSGSGGRIAWAAPGEIRAFDVAAKSMVRWPLADAANVAFDHDGHLIATTKRALWVERDGKLVLRASFDADLGAVATSSSRVWIVVGAELAILDGGAGGTLAISRGASLPATGVRLFGSPTGDVWILHDTDVRRVSPGSAADAKGDWTNTMQPIYARVCSTCHSPGGSANIDLSSFETWMARRDALSKRVVVEKSMPPTTAKAFADADRDAIKAWIERNPH